MRSRWLKWWLLGLLGSACVLNPQPDLPSGASGQPSPGDNHAGGRSAGGGQSTGSNSGGSLAVNPGVAGSGVDIGAGGDHGEAAGGDGGLLEGGAAGADQLAPGPAK